jgi:hypothetical protein
MKPAPTNFLLYTTDNQQIKVDVLIEDETVWLNQAQMGGLFQKSKATISQHIKNIFNLKQIETLTKLRDTLLPKLISGKIRIFAKN